MASIPRIYTGSTTSSSNASHHEPVCHPSQTLETGVLFTISILGIVTNGALILLVSLKKPSKRYHQTWSQGLLLHQGIVDLIRAAILIYLAMSVMTCQKLSKCFLVDTAFLLLVSVSTVNMLTMLINDAPIFPEHEQLGSITAAVSGAQRLRRAQSWLDVTAQIDLNEGSLEPSVESPYCIVFAVFIIWFSCLTIHLGPTFLSGGLTSSDGGHLDVCPMVYKPVRHYVLNVLWVLVNLMCAGLMAIHLRKLYKDIIKSNSEAARLATLVTTMIPLRSQVDELNQQHFHGYIRKLEQEGSSRVRMFIIVLAVYLACWAPLYIVTLLKPDLGSSLSYEVTIHLAFAHSFINPLLFLVMYRNLIHNETRECGCKDTSCCCQGCFGDCLPVVRPLDGDESFHLNHHGQSHHHSSQLHPITSSPVASSKRPMVNASDHKIHRETSRATIATTSGLMTSLGASVSNTPLPKRTTINSTDGKSSSSIGYGVADGSPVPPLPSSIHTFANSGLQSNGHSVDDETYPDSDTCIPPAPPDGRRTRMQQSHHTSSTSHIGHPHYVSRSITSASPDSCIAGDFSPSHIATGIKSTLVSTSTSHLHLSSHPQPHPLPHPAATTAALMHQSHSNQNLAQLQVHTHKF